jgi:hypothetical protein
MEIDPDADAEGEEEVPSPQPKVEYTTTGRGRRIAKKSYIESESEPDPLSMDVNDIFANDKPVRYRGDDGDDEDDEDDIGPRRRTRRSSQMNEFIVSDDEHPVGGRYPTRSRAKKPPPKTKPSTSNGRSTRADAQRAARQARRARRSAKTEQEEDGYIDEEQSPSSPDGEFDDAPHTSEDLEDGDVDADGEGEGGEAEQEGKPYALRQRAKINYAIPPPLEEMRPVAKSGGGRGVRSGGGGGGRNGGARPGARRGPGWSASGAELGRWMGMPGDDSVSCDRWYRCMISYRLARTRTIIPALRVNRLAACMAAGVLLLVVQAEPCYPAIWQLLRVPHRIWAKSGTPVRFSSACSTLTEPN